MRNRRNGLGSTRLILANNIIHGGRRAASIDGPLPDATWQGNIVWKTEAEIGDIPPGGYESSDPLLRQSADGVYRLEAGSRAIGRAIGSYPYVDVDIDGHARGATLDIGAQQFSTALPVNRILTPPDVGPTAP